MTPRFDDDPDSKVEPSVDPILVAVTCETSLVVLVVLVVGSEEVGEAVEGAACNIDQHVLAKTPFKYVCV